MHISLYGFVAGPNGELNWIKVDEEIFDHVGKRSVYCPPLAGAGSLNHLTLQSGVDYDAAIKVHPK